MAKDFDRAREMTGEPAWSCSGGELATLYRGSIVYGLFRDGRAIYIGMSLRGFQRPLDVGHHALGPKIVEPDDVLVAWRCETPVALERELIVALKPERNKVAGHAFGDKIPSLDGEALRTAERELKERTKRNRSKRESLMRRLAEAEKIDADLPDLERKVAELEARVLPLRTDLHRKLRVEIRRLAIEEYSNRRNRVRGALKMERANTAVFETDVKKREPALNSWGGVGRSFGPIPPVAG